MRLSGTPAIIGVSYMWKGIRTNLRNTSQKSGWADSIFLSNPTDVAIEIAHWVLANSVQSTIQPESNIPTNPWLEFLVGSYPTRLVGSRGIMIPPSWDHDPTWSHELVGSIWMYGTHMISNWGKTVVILQWNPIMFFISSGRHHRRVGYQYFKYYLCFKINTHMYGTLSTPLWSCFISWIRL